MIICSSNGVGCSGHVAVRLKWHNLQQIHPHIAIDLDLNPLQLQLHPHHLPLLSKVADCLSESSQHAQRDGGNMTPGGAHIAHRDIGFVAGARSYVESALLPNCEQLAQDVADALSWNSGTAPVSGNTYSNTSQHPSSEDLASNSNSDSAAFYDAQSMMGSVRTTFNSFLSSTAASLGSSQPFPPSPFSAHQPLARSSSSFHQRLQTGLQQSSSNSGAGQQQSAPKFQVTHSFFPKDRSCCTVLGAMLT